MHYVSKNVKIINHILLLAIQQPGLSGQPLDMAVLDKIEAINKLENRNMYNLCIDGGVNDKTVRYLNADAVVSGSYVLGSENPVKSIMVLQTSAEYEAY